MKKGVGNNNLHCVIIGNHNKIVVEKGTLIRDLFIQIEDDNNEIIINEDVIIAGKSEMFCCEGTKIILGKGCLLSTNIYFTTNDRHSIVDKNGKRINKPADILVQEHVWIGYHTTLLKGARLAKDCMVGAHSVITKEFGEENCLIVGNPAKVVKKEIGWAFERLPLV